MPCALEIKNLTKIFTVKGKDIPAVNGINLTVKSGEIFGFLGPNGAGKTTTMRMLTTLLKPTTGQAIVAGYDIATQPEMVRTQIGYVSQTGGLERSASARENLVLQARIYGMSKQQAQKRADELIKVLFLHDFADRRVETYSGGQCRRADIALGLVHKPKILFLDEPTVGLDPTSRAHIWNEIRKLREQGTTIFLTTHYLDEADILCDRVAIIDRGLIVALDSPLALKKQVGNDIIMLGLKTKDSATVDMNNLFKTIADVKEATVQKDGLRLLVRHGEYLLPQILRTCDSAGIELTTVWLHHPTLDDVFLEKTGHTFQTEATQE